MKPLTPVLAAATLIVAVLASVQPAQASVDDEFACQVSKNFVHCQVLVEATDEVWTMPGHSVGYANGFGYLDEPCSGDWTVSVTFESSSGSETHTHSGYCP